MATKTYNFSELTHEKVEALTGIKRQYDAISMEKWLAKAQEQTMEDWEILVLDMLREELIEGHLIWNEWELQLKFIAPLLSLIRFNMVRKGVNAFSERSLKVEIKQFNFYGKVDWMVASGRAKPKQPFFFIHEYKRGMEAKGDPVGQLLATMYAAQQLNQGGLTASSTATATAISTSTTPPRLSPKNLPIYGCYIIGHSWYFVVLEQDHYFITPPYGATDEVHLKRIVQLLKGQKALILEYLKQQKVS